MKRLFILLILTGLYAFFPLKAQQMKVGNYKQILHERGEVYFKFFPADRQQLQLLGHFISLDPSSRILFLLTPMPEVLPVFCSPD